MNKRLKKKKQGQQNREWNLCLSWNHIRSDNYVIRTNGKYEYEPVNQRFDVNG